MIKILKNKIQKIFKFFGFQITKNLKIHKLYIKNVFKTKYKKKVLISYITKPFTTKFDYTHTNSIECFSAAEIFKNLGYNVDVVDYNFNKKINYYEYDIIYGMGHVLEESFYQIEHSGPIRIFYATGCSTFYSDIVTTLKVREFFKRHKRFLLKSARIIRHNQVAQTLLADAVIVLGNEFVVATYKKYDPDNDRYFRLDAFSLNTYDINLEKKDFSKAKKNFLWFGSGGLLHKGLDLLLDIFSQRDDIYLHICGDLSKEKGFYEYYKDVIKNSPNIFYHGFVNIKSNLFKNIMDTCGFIVFPSVSEGGSPSLLITMANGGLVPITTKASGLDVENLGWVIKRVDIDEFEEAINQATNLDEYILGERAKKIKTYIRKKYSLVNYKRNLKKIIKEILKNN